MNNDILTQSISAISTSAKAIEELKITSRRDTAQMRNEVNVIQTACQHIFTELKSLNRSLPQ